MSINPENVVFNEANDELKSYVIESLIRDGMEQEPLESVVGKIDRWLENFFSIFKKVIIKKFSGDAIAGTIQPDRVAGVVQSITQYIQAEISKLAIPYTENTIFCSALELGKNMNILEFNREGSLTPIEKLYRYQLSQGQMFIGLFRNNQSPYQYQLVWKLIPKLNSIL